MTSVVWMILFGILAIGLGLLGAVFILALTSVATGFSEVGSWYFVLLWVLVSGGLFAWMSSIREKIVMAPYRRKRWDRIMARVESEKKRAEDPFYEPSKVFPFSEGTRKPVIDPNWGVPAPEERQDE